MSTAAAVEAATATATVKANATTAVSATTAMEATTYETTTSAVSTPSVSTPAIATSTPTATVPRASAEEDTVIEPLRAIVAIGGATIGGVSVVTVLTDGRNVRVAAADVNTKRDLRVRSGHRRQDESEDCKQCEIFEATHGDTPYRSCSNTT
jgi:hypothetical protein